MAGRTAGSIAVAFGGSTTATYTGTSFSSNILASAASGLVITPTTDFDGVVSATIVKLSPDSLEVSRDSEIFQGGKQPQLAAVDAAHRVGVFDGVAGFLSLAPDALTPVGGYPGNDDKGRELQATLDPKKMIEDFVSAAVYLKSHPECTGKVGVVGFCYGGGVANTLAVRLPDLAAAVPFYGMQPATADVPKITAPLLIHYAETDDRFNAGWPAYEAALKANNVQYAAYTYAGTNHGFHNDTTPRYDKATATLAWDRTIEFFNRTLR